MQLRFWGTRGSIPQAGFETLRHGGNTACVALRSAAGTRLVLDCGSGAHGLGRALAAEHADPVDGHLLITHTHWDHIQGFPFFAPLFTPGSQWDIYGPRGLGQSLKDSLVGQLQYTYFPVTLDGPGSTRRYHELVEGSLEIADLRVTTRFLNHPALTLGYRIEVDGVVVVYATDHEPHARRYARGIEGPLEGEDRAHADFLTGADLLIHDAQYLAEEYPDKVGWGHSTVEYVVDIARLAGVRQVALFHHDPWRSDAELQAIVARALRRVDRRGGRLRVTAAAEGSSIELDRRGAQRAGRRPVEAGAAGGASATGARIAPAPAAESARLTHAVLVATGEPELARSLVEAVRASGFEPLVADAPEVALRLCRERAPSLVLLDPALAPEAGAGLAARLRQDGGGLDPGTPMVLVVPATEGSAPPGAAPEGVTDRLRRPFTPAYARTRIAAWVLRTGGRWQAPAVPADEAERLEALRELDLMDSEPEERFDRLTRMASQLLEVPISALTLIDSDRQFFKSIQGMAGGSGPRDAAFCAHAILADVPLVVPDALLDERFADNPLVTREPFVRFYAGVPLRAEDGSAVGSLCIVDHRPRELGPREMQLLIDLASLAQEELRRGRIRADQDGQAG